MKIYLGADHAGYELKNIISEHLVHAGYDVEDEGAKTLDPADDYAQYAYAVTTKVLGEEDDPRGILICGSGQGMAIAANRVGGIRASVIWSVDGAKLTREHNDSNVLALPSRMVDTDTALAIVDAWLAEPFSGDERHERRLQQIDDLYA
ncbi:MAG TPA: RpiB/LacA/LacB family sugar-phosphate isomerase [Candidatus Saccharimonadia bacterium]|nr:RpiB/LacA/LacB family sugar-phosphate isomerase [Candidatus Saccharimonadia bacterium]